MRRALVVIGLLAAACRSSTDVPADRPLVDGVVSQVQASRALIEADVTKCERYWLAMDADTRILEELANGTTRVATPSAVTVGRRAAAWSNDPVAESCPAQGHADLILLKR